MMLCILSLYILENKTQKYVLRPPPLLFYYFALLIIFEASDFIQICFDLEIFLVLTPPLWNRLAKSKISQGLMGAKYMKS